MKIEKLYDGFNYNDLKCYIDGLMGTTHHNLQYGVKTIIDGYKYLMIGWKFFDNENEFYNLMEHNINFVLFKIHAQTKINDEIEPTYYLYVVNDNCDNGIMGIYCFSDVDNFDISTYEHITGVDIWLFCDLMCLCDEFK